MADITISILKLAIETRLDDSGERETLVRNAETGELMGSLPPAYWSLFGPQSRAEVSVKVQKIQAPTASPTAKKG